jgi:hypothetical protein
MKHILTTIFSAVILFTAFFCLNVSASDEYGIFFVDDLAICNVNPEILNLYSPELSFNVKLEEDDRVVSVLIDEVIINESSDYYLNGETYSIVYFQVFGYLYEDVNSVTISVQTIKGHRYSATINIINAAPMRISLIEANGESGVSDTTQIKISTDKDLSGAIAAESFDNPSVYVNSGFNENDIEYKIEVNADEFENEETLEISFRPGYYVTDDDENLLSEIRVIVFKEPTEPEPDPEQPEPEPNEPEPNEPEPNEPEPNEPEPNEPEQNEPELNEPEQPEPEPEQIVPEQNEPEQNEPEHSEPKSSENVYPITNNSTPYTPTFTNYYYPFNFYVPQNVYAPLLNNTEAAYKMQINILKLLKITTKNT